MSTYTLQSPLLPSWRRFKKLFGGRTELSVLRSLEYELLGDIDFSGRLLDFGGGENANYRDHMSGWANDCTYETANIDKAIRPTYLIEPGQPLPVEADTYDAVLALNTFEHIYEVRDALCEISRVLKPGGTLFATVPFLFRIHGHPDDFLRGTPSWWERTLSETGYEHVVVTPLLWGPMSTGLSVAGIPGPLKRIRMKLALMLDILYLQWVSRGSTSSRLEGEVGESLCHAPLGFFITAKKACR
jgi:SAM-dependent methyltransferase